MINADIEIIKSKNDAFLNTDLDDVLTRNEISDLYIVGLDAAYCLNINLCGRTKQKLSGSPH